LLKERGHFPGCASVIGNKGQQGAPGENSGIIPAIFGDGQSRNSDDLYTLY
jgi:hypothetical protein